MYYFRGKTPKLVLTPLKKTNSHIFKKAIFSKNFVNINTHIIKCNAGEKIKYIFLNFLLNEKLDLDFFFFKCADFTR